MTARNKGTASGKTPGRASGDIFPKRILLHPGGSLSYIFTPKPIRHMYIRIRDGQIYVSAPAHVPLAAVEQFLLSHLTRIQQAKEDAPAPLPLPAPGSDPAWEAAVRSQYFTCFGRFVAFVAEQSEHISPCLSTLGVTPAFFARSAYARHGGTVPRISFRAMKGRWGSCTPEKNTIRLSTMLSGQSPDAREGVICHELIHLLTPDHGPRFHALLDLFDPKNRERRKELRGRREGDF